MGLPIIFLHVDDSFYLKYSLESAKKYNPDSRIILIGKNITNCPDFVEYHQMTDYDLEAAKFRKVYVHSSTNNENIERFCFERWFILSEFMKKNNISKVFTLDSDVLLFENVTLDANNYSKYLFTLVDKSCGK